jgi:DNA-binding NtrC family response regulator
MQILIIEDDSNVRDLLTYGLQLEGHNVVVAEDFTHAQDLLDSGQNFQAIVSNLVLPRGRSGLDLLETMQNRGVSVLLMTGDTQTLMELERNGTPHLQKPFDLDELFSWLRKQSNDAE